MARFTGFPPAALDFYAGLQADNSKAYWQANKAVYEASIREPLLALLEDLDAEFGPFHVFRPHRDVRFAKDKSPYKDHTGAVSEREGGAIYYVQLSVSGLLAASGYYDMAPDQLARFRAAVDDDARGAEIANIVRALERRGCTAMAIGELKTAPRGFAKDHPRVALLRRKGLAVSRTFPPEPWLHTAKARARVATAWREAEPLNAWLDAHVGPSTLPPPDVDDL